MDQWEDIEKDFDALKSVLKKAVAERDRFRSDYKGVTGEYLMNSLRNANAIIAQQRKQIEAMSGLLSKLCEASNAFEERKAKGVKYDNLKSTSNS